MEIEEKKESFSYKANNAPPKGSFDQVPMVDGMTVTLPLQLL
jgi:hypothetical protein